jgi:hypothetical protein
MTTLLQSSSMLQLNAAVKKIYYSITAIIDIEATFEFEEDRKDLLLASGQFVDLKSFSGFGDFEFGKDQRIVRQWGVYPYEYFSVRLPCFVVFPDALQKLFEQHVQNELFDVPFERLGLATEVTVYFSCDTVEFVPLNSSTAHICMNGFTESYFRARAPELLAELTPYLEWMQYFEHMASELMDSERRQRLIADANMILAYLYAGGTLNFAKLTSLCDVAGSLQPARNLIQKDMPELAV